MIEGGGIGRKGVSRKGDERKRHPFDGDKECKCGKDIEIDGEGERDG